MTRKRPAKPSDAATWRNDPVAFAKRVLGASLWPLQAEILRSVVANRRTAAASCHSSGKTYLSAIAALYWLLRWPDARVIVVGPGYTQIRTVLFAEIHRHLRRMRYRVDLDANRTEIRLSPTNYILGIATNESARLQGHHAKNLLVIADEAVGIAGDIWEGVESLLASGDAHILAVSNPTTTDGNFYRIFTRERASWNLFTIDAWSTPNFAGIGGIDELLAMPDAELDRNEWPMLIGRRWVRDRYQSWFNGDIDNSPLWASRILGRFPSQSEMALCALAWIEQAQGPATDDGGPVTAGIDVAAGGADRSVLTIVGASGVLEQRAWNVSDARGVLAAALGRWKARLTSVNVDTTGVGFHVETHLRDLGFSTRPINFGSSAMDTERFSNAKAEIFWTLREQLQSGRLAGVSDELAGELAILRWEVDPKGRTGIESKDKLRARGRRSPDLADSLALALSGRVSGDAVKSFLRQAASLAPSSIVAADEAREREYRHQAGLLFNPGAARSPNLPARVCCYCGQNIPDGVSYQRTGTLTGMALAHADCARRALYGG